MSINTVCWEMRAVSSHRVHRGSKMRFLIIFAFLACAAAAPSGFLTPLAVPAVAYSVLPTISPGDIQGAAIDAQVKAQDLAIAAVDKARELSELELKNVNEKVEASNDQVKENLEEQFWSVEERKWQALDALKTAEAQIDGSVASNAEVLAKSAVGPYVTYSHVPLTPNIAPYAAPISSIVYTPGIVAPEFKIVTAEAKLKSATDEAGLKTAADEGGIKTAAAEDKEVKEIKMEALVKSAEKVEMSDSVAVEAAKSDEKTVVVKSLEAQPLASVIATPLVAEQYRYPIAAPALLKYDTVVPYGVQTIGLAPQQIGLAPQQIGLAPQPIGLTPSVYNIPAVYNTVW